MKSKLIETVTYKGNGLAPINHSGFDSAIIIVKGGSDIWLASADTEDGEYTKFCSLNIGASVLDIAGCKKFIKIINAEVCDVLLGDCVKDPEYSEVEIGVSVANLYAYSYTEEDEAYMMYTYEPIVKTGEIAILVHENDLTYGYDIVKRTIEITNVDEDGKLTDSNDIVYTPINEKNISL
ncbi:MAG: hypothetical protein MJ179_02595 [Treponema sp.]|nr:hypothetical protein [Treponema sp.]